MQKILIMILIALLVFLGVVLYGVVKTFAFEVPRELEFLNELPVIQDGYCIEIATGDMRFCILAQGKDCRYLIIVDIENDIIKEVVKITSSGNTTIYPSFKI